MFYDEDGIYVIDDFISEESQKFLEELFTNDDFPYYYNAASNGTNQEDNTRVIANRNTFDHGQFTHLLWWLDNDEFFHGDKDNCFRKSDHYEKVIDIFKESYIEFFYDGKQKNKFTVSKRIESKRGRCVIFDSRRYHSAGKCPPDKIRVVVNTMIGRLDDL